MRARACIGEQQPVSNSRLTRTGQTAGPGAVTHSPSDHGAVTKAARGIAERTASTLSFDAGTRTFTITPANGAFSYYIAGRRYIKSAAESIVIADTSGPHWIYYDGATLSSVVNANHETVDDLIVNKVRIGIVYWNATDGVGHLVADERHGTVMSGASQEWKHDSIGAVWMLGLALSGYTLDTDTDAGVDFEVTDGRIRDEDLEHDIVDGAPATQYAQQLNGGNAEVPIAYRDDVDGTWTQDAATTLPYKRFGAGRLAYNKDDGDGTWSQVEVTNNRFVLATLVATNDWQLPIKMVQGQAEYTDKKTAIEEANAEQIAWGTMITPEIVPLYRLVMETADGLGGTNKCKIVAVFDLRRLSISGGLASPAEAHALLNGSTHSDSVAAAVTAGALLYGNATPEWAKHALVTLNDAGEMAGLTKLDVDNLRFDAAQIEVIGGGQNLILKSGAGFPVRIPIVGATTLDKYAWHVENAAWAPAMINTRTSMLFMQAFDNGPTFDLSGQITVGTETNWGVAATRDAYMAFYTALNGTTAEKMRINSVGQVGINTTDPGGRSPGNIMLDIRREGDGLRSGIGVYTHENVTANRGSIFFAARSRGTLATPTVVQNGDRLFAFSAQGYDGAAWRGRANIIFDVDGVVALNSVPTSLAFWTGPTPGTFAERFKIQSDGDILVDSGTSVFVRDSALGFNSSVDGQLDIFADVEVEITAPTIQLNATTIDLVGRVTVPGDGGIDYLPGADIDVTFVSLFVTGGPRFWWDESEDAFAMTHRLLLPEGVQTQYVTDNVEVEIAAPLIDLNAASIFASTLKSGINQADAGAAAGELWVDTARGEAVKRGV